MATRTGTIHSFPMKWIVIGLAVVAVAALFFWLGQRDAVKLTSTEKTIAGILEKPVTESVQKDEPQQISARTTVNAMSIDELRARVISREIAKGEIIVVEGAFERFWEGADISISLSPMEPNYFHFAKNSEIAKVKKLRPGQWVIIEAEFSYQDIFSSTFVNSRLIDAK